MTDLFDSKTSVQHYELAKALKGNQSYLTLFGITTFHFPLNTAGDKIEYK